jgi:hypothetical protein
MNYESWFLTAPSVFSNVYLINIYINFANIKTKACWRGLYLISCPVLTSFFSIFILLSFFNIYESYIFLHKHILHYNAYTLFSVFWKSASKYILCFLKINYISVFSYCPFSFGHFIACLQFTASDYLFVLVKLI